MKNPVTMIGTIDRCWLFAFRTPIAAAKKLLPAPLEPVTRGEWAFWNIVVSHIDAMRPWPLPALAGMSYWHVAYRLYARCYPENAAALEGLYFIRSDCDSSLMSWAGNIMTDFNFHTARIAAQALDGEVDITIDKTTADAHARLSLQERPALPANSIFSSLDEAAGFLKYKPNGLSIASNSNVSIVHISRREQDWRYRLVNVKAQQWSFFNDKDVHFEICYQVEPIFYRWNRARIYHCSLPVTV